MYAFHYKGWCVMGLVQNKKRLPRIGLCMVFKVYIPLIVQFRGFPPGEHRTEGLQQSIFLASGMCRRMQGAHKALWGVFGCT